MHHLISMPRHFVLGLACAAALSAWSVQAQTSSPEVTRALSDSAHTSSLSGAASPGLRSADYIVAIVNSEPVTNNEVRARVQRVLENLQAQGVQPPAASALMPDVLERLIVEKIQVQTALETGIRVDDYAVDQAVQNISRQSGLTPEAMRQELLERGQSPETLREEIRNQMLMQRLQGREVNSRVQVADHEIDAYLQAQKQQSGQGDLSNALLNLGHILIAVPEGASQQEVAQLQALAQEAVQAARTQSDFVAVAQRYSQGGVPTSGMRPASRHPSLFVEAVAQTPVGGVVGPVRSGAGFHVLKVLDKSAEGVDAVVTQNHARHILLRTSPQLSEREAAQRLSELRQRLEGGANFADLARQYSEDGSAPMGGDLGWAGTGQFVPEFEEALNALQPGQVSQPVVTRFGVHLIQLLDRRQATLTPREQREMLRNIVREEKFEKAYANWLQELRGQAYVEYREPPQ